MFGIEGRRSLREGITSAGTNTYLGITTTQSVKYQKMWLKEPLKSLEVAGM
jgi:hypothetical protein